MRKSTVLAAPQLGSKWTVADQGFRDDHLNYQHVRDEDLIVEVMALDADRVKLRYVAGSTVDKTEELSLREFLAIYRPIDNREQGILDQIAHNASYTGEQFCGPWHIRICGGCSLLLNGLGHNCHDGAWIHDERAVEVTVVRQPT